MEILERIEHHIRRNELIAPGGEVTCLVSGGADSTCLYDALHELGYSVSAFHVDYGLRGDASDADARLCAEQFGAEVVRVSPVRATEVELREIRYSFGDGRLRATGHTATDQVETILYRLVASGNTKGIKACREDGVVRPLLSLWREETEAYCRERGLAFRVDSTNPATVRGLIRDEILPLLERIHPSARENILRVLDERRTMPPALAELLAAPVASKRVDLGGGLQAVREHDRLWLEHGPVELRGEVRWGPWRIASELPGSGSTPGVRVTGSRVAPRRSRTCSSTPRSRAPSASPGRSSCAADEVVAVPGLIEAQGVTAVRDALRAGGHSVTKTELERGVGETLIDAERLQARVRELAAEISADYAGRELLLVGVLKGAVFFMADLMRSITVPCEIDFMAISSYGASTDSSGVVRILKDLDLNIEGRHVVIVEDIVDSGLTLSYLDAQPRVAGAGLSRGLRAADEARAPRNRGAGSLYGLRDPEQVRDRLRARFRRALPEPALRRRPAR